MTAVPETSNPFEGLVAQYRSARPTYEAFVENINILLVSLLRSKGIEHLPLEMRTKTVESFGSKLTRPEKEEKYQALSDITDLAGIRVVVYYERDVDRVCDLIQSNFVVDEENSADKTGSIEADRFGYLSRHFIVSHGASRRDLPENVQFANLKAEVQVRTVVQHAWAVIDRRLRYNNEADIPRELRRKLFRISALLEMADKEFSEVDSAISALRRDYERDVRSGNLQIEVNRDSVEIFIQRSSTIGNLRAIADSLNIGVASSEESLTGLVQTIAAAGFRSIDEVDYLIKPAPELEKRLKSYIVETRPKDMTSSMSNAYLTRLAILLSLPKIKTVEILKSVPLPDEKLRQILLGIMDPKK